MTLEQTKVIIKMLIEAYPHSFTNKTSEQLKSMCSLWQELLKDLKYKYVYKAVMELCRTEKFLPTVAHIREKYQEVSQFKVPDDLEYLLLCESKGIPADRNSEHWKQWKIEQCRKLGKHIAIGHRCSIIVLGDVEE